MRGFLGISQNLERVRSPAPAARQAVPRLSPRETAPPPARTHHRIRGTGIALHPSFSSNLGVHAPLARRVRLDVPFPDENLPAVDPARRYGLRRRAARLLMEAIDELPPPMLPGDGPAAFRLSEPPLGVPGHELDVDLVREREYRPRQVNRTTLRLSADIRSSPPGDQGAGEPAERRAGPDAVQDPAGRRCRSPAGVRQSGGPLPRGARAANFAANFWRPIGAFCGGF